MKKQKLKIDKIKVESFVTNLDEGKKQTVEGGNFLEFDRPYSQGTWCHSCAVSNCCDTEHQLCPNTNATACTHFHTGCTDPNRDAF